ncbi:TolC family protein [Frateuria aurantia]
MRLPWVLSCIAAVALSACTGYSPKPLPVGAHSLLQASDLVGAGKLPVPWSQQALERLVLLNNPQLKAARARHRVAEAAMLQAGLLPNPAYTGSLGYLMSGPGFATAWTSALTQDVVGLLTLKPRREAAHAELASVDAQLLWQEWQTLAMARLLMVDLVEGRQILAIQQADLQRLERHRKAVLAALDQGLVERAGITNALMASSDALSSVQDLRHHLLDIHQQLCAMLGLRPTSQLPLPAVMTAAPLDLAQVQRESLSVEQRRPDLMALQFGYQAQDARLRAQLMASFPGLTLGYATSSDNSHVYNGGPQISFQLPIFDHNQHAVAMERATRDQLWLDYKARVAQARDAVEAVGAQYRQGQADLSSLPSPAVDETASQQTAAAWQDGSIDQTTYVVLSHDLAVRAIRRVALKQAQMERQVALQTLVGDGLPRALPVTVTTP